MSNSSSNGRGLESAHALQMEHGQTGLWLSMGSKEKKVLETQAAMDALLNGILNVHIPDDLGLDEVFALDERVETDSSMAKI